MWHDGIIAVYPARDDYGENFSAVERYVYCICAEYQDGRCEPLPGTYTNVTEVKKETRRYAKLITELNGVKCEAKPLREMAMISDAEKSKKHIDKLKKYMRDQKEKKRIKMMTNTVGGREYY